MALTVLGIETSCDETAAAVVRGAPGAVPTILSNVVLSQLAEHRPFGGVVPEIAARAHIEHLDAIIARACAEAGCAFDDLDAVAGTAGPGLIGGVMVGLTEAKAIALAAAKPFLAINHLEAHALSVQLTEPIAFPYLVLLVSGGHCQLLVAEEGGHYRRWGTTVDDAVGEAFDKAAKLLSLGFPGGPAIERLAARGDPSRFALPRPMVGRADCHFSFSGLKTALARLVESHQPLSDGLRADMAASFQAAIADCLLDRSRVALDRFEPQFGAGTFVLVGGVAANEVLRRKLADLAALKTFRFAVPPPRLCTDNGAMIAWAGLVRLARGERHGLDAPARPRWPLDPDAPPAPFAGVKA